MSEKTDAILNGKVPPGWDAKRYLCLTEAAQDVVDWCDHWPEDYVPYEKIERLRAALKKEIGEQ